MEGRPLGSRLLRRGPPLPTASGARRLLTWKLHGRETRRELPAQLLAAVMAGIERATYATDLRALQAEVAELKADVAELKQEAG